ncbi:hypothetical protein HU200_016259 [Digitaria exilis]|uniref:Glutaredoxin domain-containing protein n=1 Tax=Digitaria exilis TaxID=1010633 RepID=A0A835F9E9_9POAL|nr:hypothetical protein HU200_016259 [Digitaria exilis]
MATNATPGDDRCIVCPLSDPLPRPRGKATDTLQQSLYQPLSLSLCRSGVSVLVAVRELPAGLVGCVPVRSDEHELVSAAASGMRDDKPLPKAIHPPPSISIPPIDHHPGPAGPAAYKTPRPIPFPFLHHHRLASPSHTSPRQETIPGAQAPQAIPAALSRSQDQQEKKKKKNAADGGRRVRHHHHQRRRGGVAGGGGGGIRVARMASGNAVVVFSSSGCCMCHVVKRLLLGLGVGPTVYELDHLSPGGRDIQAALSQLLPPGHPPVPVVFVGGRLLGGVEKVMACHINGTLVPLLKQAGALWL